MSDTNEKLAENEKLTENEKFVAIKSAAANHDDDDATNNKFKLTSRAALMQVRSDS